MTKRPNRKELVSWNRHVYAEIHGMLLEIDELEQSKTISRVLQIEVSPEDKLLSLIEQRFTRLLEQYKHYCDVM